MISKEELKHSHLMAEISHIAYLLAQFATDGNYPVSHTEQYSNSHMYLLEAQARLNTLVQISNIVEKE